MWFSVLKVGETLTLSSNSGQLSYEIKLESAPGDQVSVRSIVRGLFDLPWTRPAGTWITLSGGVKVKVEPVSSTKCKFVVDDPNLIYSIRKENHVTKRNRFPDDHVRDGGDPERGRRALEV